MSKKDDKLYDYSNTRTYINTPVYLSTVELVFLFKDFFTEEEMVLIEKEYMKEEIKQLRINIDGLAQLIKNLKPITTMIYGEPCDCFCHSKDGETMSHMGACCNNGIKFGTEKPGHSYNSDELNKAYDSLILAKAWLGKLLGELGESTPYANDGNRKAIEDIEPTADVAGPVVIFKDFNHIEKVDWLKEEIKFVLDGYLKTKDSFTSVGLAKDNINNLTWREVTKHLSEARFWLGFELQRIKENK